MQERISRVGLMFEKAKKKALFLLQYRDYTEQELQNRLEKEEFSKDVIQEVIAYCKSYHYIDDERYAKAYIRAKKEKKSKKWIAMRLVQKGLDMAVIQCLLEEEVPEESIAIQRQLRACPAEIKEWTLEQKRKKIASLCRKGFSYEEVKRYFEI